MKDWQLNHKNIMKFISGILKIVTAPAKFMQELINSENLNSSRRFLYIVLGLDIVALTWFIIFKKVLIINKDLIEYTIDAHLWLIAMLLGSVTVKSITDAVGKRRLKVPDIEDTGTFTKETTATLKETVKKES